MTSIKSVKAALNIKWMSLQYFTKGWGFFFEEESSVLAVLCSAVGLLDVILGRSFNTILIHMILIVLIRRVFAGGICTSSKRLDGQVVVVTGCNVGIGMETARDLSRRGAKIIMACRDTNKAQKVAAEIQKQTGGIVEVIKLDLASLTSVRNFAEELKVREPQIDILINNAGIMMCPLMKTEDGFEMQMGTNHFGHFLLTNLLLPLLTHSKPARIITLSSLAHVGGKIPFEDINYEKGYNRIRAYKNSKFANVLFTRQLASRLKGTNIQVFAVHPGAVQSNLGRHILGQLGASFFAQVICKSTREGAQTSLYCALEANQEDPHYYADCGHSFMDDAAADDDLADKFWTFSEKMVGISH